MLVSSVNSSPKTETKCQKLMDISHAATFRRQKKNFIPNTYSCAVCKFKSSTKTEYLIHFKDHGRHFLIRTLKTAFKLDKRLFGICVEFDKKSSSFKFSLDNTFGKQLVLTDIYLNTSIGLDPILSGEKIVLKPSESFTFSTSMSRFRIPKHKYSLLVKTEDVVFELIEHYHLNLKGKLTRGDKGDFEYKDLHSFPESSGIKILHWNRFRDKTSFNSEEKSLLTEIKSFTEVAKNIRGMNQENFVSVLNIMNQIEDYELTTNYRSYTIFEAKLIECITNGFYILELTQFMVPPALLRPEDELKVTNNHDEIEGVIDCIIKSEIIIELEKPISIEKTVKVEFLFSRFTFMLEYTALVKIKQLKINPLFFPELPQNKFLKITQFNWFNRDIATNREQIIAIQNIVNDTAFPAPYILFGPPGTGKTSTLVEAICQIYRFKPKSNILVTAETNFACNEVANRLLKHLPKNNLYRFCSRSSEKYNNDMNSDLLKNSNMDKGKQRTPFYREIYNNRIVVCTLATSGRLVQASIASDFFDYIFIDECGSAKEVSSLIPLAGLTTSKNGQINAKIILAGDPKQLGPVVYSSMARKMGLNISMLERLMNYKIYKKDPRTNIYNNQLITKLLENYRSHEAILQFSNENFYDGELKAMAKAEITDWALSWSQLQNTKFPVIFHCAFGEMHQDKFSLSFENRWEIGVVKSYIKDLLTNKSNNLKVVQSDIGVISPYAKQVRSIRDMCSSSNWKNIEVGSTEQFQGREKKIIIISTVRSGTKTVGFLDSEKRLNVALTRAKSLLIVIGNAKTLEKDRYWYKFIEYCINNGSINGSSFTIGEVEVSAENASEDEMCYEDDFLLINKCMN